MKNPTFHNKDLQNDISKILDYDDITLSYDDITLSYHNEDHLYYLDVNDNGYGYGSKKERDSDYEKLKKYISLMKKTTNMKKTTKKPTTPSLHHLPPKVTFVMDKDQIMNQPEDIRGFNPFNMRDDNQKDDIDEILNDYRDDNKNEVYLIHYTIDRIEKVVFPKASYILEPVK